MEIDGESVDHSANETGGVRHAVAPSPVTREGTLGGHLARRLVQIGVRDIFTVPGDFNLALLDHLIAEPGLNNVGCCNEIEAGYAADGYARANGVGACVVTFTVGGLSVINAIAGAYSENLPVICIVGGPNSNDDGTDRILDHTIGLPDFTQELKCFQTVTCYQAVVNNLDDAHELIDSAISTAVKESKPVYISISCNLPSISHPFFTIEPLPFYLSPRSSNQMGLECAVEATAEFLNKAVKPVLVGGPKMRVAKRHALSSNQLAAIVLRLKMEGKHQEADKIFKRMDVLEKNSKKAILQEIGGSTSRCIKKQLLSEILTQKERCQFCFENAYRPKHLVVSIGNATYLMLPTWEPLVQGHCCILPLQHESATRTIDKNVWEELRNFKKCLLKMFSREGKDVIFLETVTGLSRQRRHCLIECIPIPSYKAKQAPLYFKKAIDEAEGEWGQHDMKKVIPTSGNLRNVIPENFSYFHVEFGLDNGFVHVIDDDTNFPSSFGSNVIRGMLCLPEETMHRHQRRQPAEKQKQAIADFVREWKPFDWTSALE